MLKPRAKHPVKVHVWAGISHRGRTPIAIFQGTMNAELYVSILQRALLPFIARTYPDSHRLMQDNDPKHTSYRTVVFFFLKKESTGGELLQSPPISTL